MFDGSKQCLNRPKIDNIALVRYSVGVSEITLMIAIIQTGGKQYQVAVGTKVKVEKLTAAVGEEVTFPSLFVGDEQSVQVATPELKATVSAKVLAHGKHAEVKGIRHKAKKRELTRYGHRQPYTEVEITKIAA